MPSLTRSLFLTILADHLNGRATALPDDYDEAELLTIARQQQCEGIVYHQTHIPSLQRAYALTTFYAVNRRDLLRQIHEVFTERNIPYILFKGTEIARFYPVPMLRTMGDSDILVRKEDRNRADEALASIGFDSDKTGVIEWHYHKANMDFELHHRLLYDEPVNLPHLRDWTDSVWEHASVEDGIRYSIEPEYNLVYLLIHLRKHLLNSGIGFRQFMDVAVMARQELDWDKVNGYLDEIGLKAFAENCFAFCARCFKVTLPIIADISDEFYETAVEKIFAGGVFGFSDESNKDNLVNFKLQNKSRVRVFVEYLFLPYSHLSKLDAFSFLDGKPYLLPVAWVYRVIRIFKEHRTDSAARNMFAPLTTHVIDGREDYLKQWGL
ncbi:MAG: nucleotidyltransferase family protein [Eubacteriales bacterium]|nr:nucleotidyltransferase family protein [Eubacteriales bacterium]